MFHCQTANSNKGVPHIRIDGVLRHAKLMQSCMQGKMILAISLLLAVWLESLVVLPVRNWVLASERECQDCQAILTAGQPSFSISRGATRRPAKEPTWRPEKMKPIARDRSLCLQILATMSVAEVGATPSPRPTRTLQRKIPARNGMSTSFDGAPV